VKRPADDLIVVHNMDNAFSRHEASQSRSSNVEIVHSDDMRMVRQICTVGILSGQPSLKPLHRMPGPTAKFADPVRGVTLARLVAVTDRLAAAYGAGRTHGAPQARWVHLISTLPFLLLVAIPPLRPIKGVLVAS
jgi:hypothetical protein